MKTNLFNKIGSIVTVLEIGKEWLKVVQAEHSKAGNKISYLEAIEVSSATDEEVIEKISELSKRNKIDSNKLLILIPHDMVSVKNLNLPSTNQPEIEDMIDLQIGKQTPYSSNEIIKGYLTSESYMSGYSRVMLAIAHRNLVQRYFKLIEGVGLAIKKIGFSTEGLLAWKHFAYDQNLASNKSIALIDIDCRVVDFEIVAGGNTIFSRSLKMETPESLSSSEAWQDKFVEEAARSIYAYQNEVVGYEVTEIVISAGLSIKQRLNKELLRKKLGLPVKIIDQLDPVPKTNKAVSLYDSLSKKDLSFASLFGSALFFGKQKINFMPQEIKMERSFQERGKDIYRIGITSVFILVLISSLFFGRVYNKSRYLNQLNARLSEIEDEARVLNNMLSQTILIKERLNTRSFTLDLIYEVYKAIPADLYLTAMVFDGKESLNFRGNSNTMSEVFNFAEELEKSEYFKNITVERATQRSQGGKDLVNFEILCPIEAKYRNIVSKW